MAELFAVTQRTAGSGCACVTDDVIGALSLITWSLLIVVIIKYVCFVLLANDDGEGGTFAIYSVAQPIYENNIQIGLHCGRCW